MKYFLPRLSIKLMFLGEGQSFSISVFCFQPPNQEVIREKSKPTQENSEVDKTGKVVFA